MTAPRRQSRGREEWLDQLSAAYERGRLVPFIGAGMSSPACALWDGFVSKLETGAGLEPAVESADPTHRAARAVRKLRLGASRQVLAKAVEAALPDGAPQIPRQTRELAGIFWPLVVTTNYDDLYVAAAHEAHVNAFARPRGREKDAQGQVPPLFILGRSPGDCRRLLASLRQPDVPILWALQGFVGGQAEPYPDQCRGQERGSGQKYRDCLEDVDYAAQCEALKRELVVGHAEYRRVALASEPFRRAFAELYRSRSLLFLGSGLRDTYFLDLFSEIIELYGPSPHPHFAILAERESDSDFLRQFFGIWVVEIKTYGLLRKRLKQLATRITSPRTPQLSWHFGAPRVADPAGRAELRIVRGEVPADPDEGECVVFSAGGSSGKLSLSGVGKDILDPLGLAWDVAAFEPIGPKVPEVPLWRHRQDRRFLAVNARLDPWYHPGARLRPTDPKKWPIGNEKGGTAGGRARRDLRLMSLAVEKLMRVASAEGYRHVHSMLLAGGRLRTFPQSQALLQMARGWGRWRGAAEDALPDLSIYIHPTAREVLYDLDAGRLDIARSLAPGVEFWLEISTEDGGVERHFHVAPGDRSLLAVLEEVDVSHPSWRLELVPLPCWGWRNWTRNGIDAWESKFGTLSLEAFGVVPGSTLRLIEEVAPVTARDGQRACKRCGAPTWSSKSPYCLAHRPPVR